jgi:hypothetical protein
VRLPAGVLPVGDRAVVLAATSVPGQEPVVAPLPTRWCFKSMRSFTPSARRERPSIRRRASSHGARVVRITASAIGAVPGPGRRFGQSGERSIEGNRLIRPDESPDRWGSYAEWPVKTAARESRMKRTCSDYASRGSPAYHLNAQSTIFRVSEYLTFGGTYDWA